MAFILTDRYKYLLLLMCIIVLLSVLYATVNNFLFRSDLLIYFYTSVINWWKFQNSKSYKWNNVFKNGPIKICWRQPLKVSSDIVCLTRPYQFKPFKVCFPQILPGTFLNIIPQILQNTGKYWIIDVLQNSCTEKTRKIDSKTLA